MSKEEQGQLPKLHRAEELCHKTREGRRPAEGCEDTVNKRQGVLEWKDQGNNKRTERERVRIGLFSDKNAKDKDAFAKERKSWNQKEESFKMCVKTYEDKLNNLEKKINKMQKGDKIEYKNTFEVNVIFQKTERILLGKEYAQMVAKQTVEAQKTFL